MTRYSFTVEKTPAGFVAYLGDYDLDAPVAYGPAPSDAIIDWLQMWGDVHLKYAPGGIGAVYTPQGAEGGAA